MGTSEVQKQARNSLIPEATTLAVKDPVASLSKGSTTGSNVVFCRMVKDYCRNGKMVTIFMPMYHVSMIFDPVCKAIEICPYTFAKLSHYFGFHCFCFYCQDFG